MSIRIDRHASATLTKFYDKLSGKESLTTFDRYKVSLPDAHMDFDGDPTVYVKFHEFAQDIEDEDRQDDFTAIFPLSILRAVLELAEELNEPGKHGYETREDS